jgi:hypothetical protein
MEGEGRALCSGLRFFIIELASIKEQAVEHSVAAFLKGNGSSFIFQRTNIVVEYLKTDHLRVAYLKTG